MQNISIVRKTTEKQQFVEQFVVACGTITEINQVILLLLTLNLLNTSITGTTYSLVAGHDGHNANKVGKNETEIVLCNFWRTLNVPLINCEIELILAWSINCVLADMTERDAGNNHLPAIVAPSELKFKVTQKIAGTNCYVVNRK